MTSFEKGSIRIPTAAAVLITIGGIMGNYYATRTAVQLEMNQIKNDIILEKSERKGADDMLELKITGMLKPEKPKLQDER